MKHTFAPESYSLLLTSALYILVGSLVSENNLLIIAVGILALLHHSFTDNQPIRFLDWSVSAFLVYKVVSHGNLINSTILTLVFGALVSWIISIYYFHVLKSFKSYTIWHNIWHILSAIILYIIFK